MAEFLRWLQNPTVQIVGWVFGGIGWIIGIASGWIQWKSYREQKQRDAAYREILGRAQQDWEGRYTEEQVQQLTEQFRQLQDKIRREVPHQARRVFLEDQLSALADNIAQFYQRYTKVASELTDIPPPDFLPLALREAIERTIMPSYLIRQRQQRLTHWLLISILLFTIVPFFATVTLALLPREIEIGGTEYPSSWMVTFGAIVVLVTSAIAAGYRKKVASWVAHHSILRWLAVAFGWVLSLLLFGFLFIMADVSMHLHDLGQKIMLVPLGLIVASSMGLSILLTIYTLLETVSSRMRRPSR